MKTSQELIEAILAEEKMLYAQFKDFQESFGANDEATLSAMSQWSAVESLIDNLNIR